MAKRVLALLFSGLIAASGGVGVVLHVCQSMGGIVVGDCDCEAETQHDSHGARGDEVHGHDAPCHRVTERRFEAERCCTVELAETHPLLATNDASMLRADDAPTLVVGWNDTRVPNARVACDPTLLRERSPPKAQGPPLFIRHCALLN